MSLRKAAGRAVRVSRSFIHRIFPNGRAFVKQGTYLIRRALYGADASVFTERPYELHLELTNLCNAKCIFCPYTLQTRSHEFMTEEVFKKAVADYVDIGGGSVGLTPIVGDPLIHPKFVEWVRYLRAIQQIDRISVTTNAILLRRHGVEAILNSGLSFIHISLAGFEEDMYRRIYRNDSYRSVRDGLYELYEANARRSSPIPIFLNLRPDRPAEEVLSDPDLQPLLRYEPNISFAGTFSRSGGLITILPPGMVLEPVTTKPKRKPCASTYSGLMVLSNGNVQVCVCESSVNADALVVGNIKEESLLSIWQGERLRALRASFRNGTLNSNCARCDRYYEPVDLYTKASSKRAQISRRRQRGDIVRHSKPILNGSQFE